MTVEDILNGWYPPIDWVLVLSVVDVLGKLIIPILGFAVLTYTFTHGYRNYKKSTFYNTVTFSLNMFNDEINENKSLLIFRTQLEGHLEDFVPKSGHLYKAIEKAARECTIENMFMHVGGTPRAQEMFLNSLSSHWIAQESADGDLAKAMGLPTIEISFWFGATYEPYESPSVRKIRCMIITEDNLLNRIYSTENFLFEQKSHNDRTHTLGTMQDLHRNLESRKKFLIKRTITKRI